MNDQDTTLAELKAHFESFLAERGWNKHHNPQQLAMSISIEAAELLEHFQWGDYATSNKEEWADELADIINYCLSFASATGIDIASAVERKLEKAAKKYPVSVFNPDQNSTQEYWAIKKQYRENQK